MHEDMVSKNFFSALDDSEDEGDTLKGFVDERKGVFDDFLNKDNNECGNKISNSEGPSSNERRCHNNNKIGRGRQSHTREGRCYYDRRSGTGRGREVRKVGSGSHNWGSEKSEACMVDYHLSGLQNNDKNINNTEASTGEISQGNSKLVDNSTEGTEEAIQRDEYRKQVAEKEKTMTLEEFLRSKTNPESELFKPKDLKSVDNEFIGKNARIAVKEDVLIMGKDKKLRKKSSKKNEKVTIDVSFSNAKPMKSNRRSDERVRRGVSKSGKCHREKQNGANVIQEWTLNAMDTTAFPSL